MSPQYVQCQHVECLRILPRSEFGTERRRANGLNRYCKACARRWSADWRSRNPDLERAKRTRYRKSHRLAYNVTMAKNNAARRARLLSQSCTVHPECADIDLRSWYEGTKCQDCGTTLTGSAVQVDHNIPIAKGGIHCRFNLRPLCRPCNSKKGAKLPEQVSLFMLSEHRDLIARVYDWEKN